jgi:hypothetical protein
MSRSPGAWRRSAPFCVNGSRLAWRLCNPRPAPPAHARARRVSHSAPPCACGCHPCTTSQATVAITRAYKRASHALAIARGACPLLRLGMPLGSFLHVLYSICMLLRRPLEALSWQWLRASDCSLLSVVSCRYLETKDFTSAISVLNGLIIEVKRLDDKLLLVPLPLAHPRSHPRNACWSTRVAHSCDKPHPPNMPHPLRSTHAAARRF